MHTIASVFHLASIASVLEWPQTKVLICPGHPQLNAGISQIFNMRLAL
jgi:hypothetical protein